MTDVRHEWCAGLPVLRSRALTVAERGRLRLTRRSAILRASAWLLVIPVILAVCATVFALASTPRGPVLELGAVLVVLMGVFLCVPMCIALANDEVKRSGVLKRQGRDSEVLVCRGAAADLVVAQPKDLDRLRRQAGDASAVVLEVLRQSGLVWAVNGRPTQSWIVAPRGRTAGPPAQARLAAGYVRPVETGAGTVRVHRRRLSDAECAELAGYLPRATTAAGLGALLVNAAAVAQLVAYVRHPIGVPLIGIVLLTTAAWCDAQLLLVIRARRRMRRDLRAGFVVIYQPDPGLDASADSVVEFLPHSGAEWTTGGRAASWRRLYGTTGPEPPAAPAAAPGG
jgi:hypothetical protein